MCVYVCVCGGGLQRRLASVDVLVRHTQHARGLEGAKCDEHDPAGPDHDRDDARDVPAQHLPRLVAAAVQDAVAYQEAKGATRQTIRNMAGLGTVRGVWASVGNHHTHIL